MKRDSHKIDKSSADAEPATHAPSAQEAFASYAAPLVGEAIEYAGAVREDASPEALHKLRVSLRRLRSLWWAFDPLLEKSESTRQRALYKFLATAAGKTRDWDILIGLLEDEGSSEEKNAGKSDGRSGGNSDGNSAGNGVAGPARRVAPTLLEARAAALATSRETLTNSDAKHLLHDALSTSTKELNTAHERVPLREFAERRVAASERSLKKRMKRARHAKRSNYLAFHDVRKAGKKVRYLLEFFGPVLRGEHKRTLKSLKKIQKRFGALNDVVASETLLRDNTALLAGSGDTDAALHWLDKERKRRLRSAARLLRKL